MKILIDANVLYPTVMREVVLGVAKTGLFTPQWSARILEEWARAAIKLGPQGEAQARGEIAEQLIEHAHQRGSNDNITAVVVDLRTYLLQLAHDAWLTLKHCPL